MDIDEIERQRRYQERQKELSARFDREDIQQENADLEAVRQAGVDRALELASGTQTSTDTMKMEVALIDFRSREQRMRDEGYPDAADAFVDAFIATLDSVNPSLAAELK